MKTLIALLLTAVSLGAQPILPGNRGAFTGTFTGNGAGLTNVASSGVIGFTVPEAGVTLEVSNSAPRIRLRTSTTATYDLYTDGVYAYFGDAANIIKNFQLTPGGGAIINTFGNVNALVVNNLAPVNSLFIANTTGEVGLGITPSAHVDVAGSGRFTGGVSIRNDYILHRVYGLGDSLTFSGNYPGAYLSTVSSLLGTNWGVANCGIYGQRTDQMLARLQRTILDQVDCEYVVLWGGINDVSQGVAASVIESNLQYMVNMIRSDGKRVVSINLTPWKGSATWTSGKQIVSDAVNTWLSSTATNINYKIDAYSALVDGSNPQTLNTIYDSGDHLHLTTLGYSVVGTNVYTGTTWTADFANTNSVVLSDNLLSRGTVSAAKLNATGMVTASSVVLTNTHPFNQHATEILTLYNLPSAYCGGCDQAALAFASGDPANPFNWRTARITSDRFTDASTWSGDLQFQTHTLGAMANDPTTKMTIAADGLVSIGSNLNVTNRLLTIMSGLSIVGTNVTVDFSKGNKFAITATTNLWFGLPSNLTAMQDIMIDLRQDATGGRTVNFDTNYWKFPSGQILTTTTNANSWNLLSCIVGQYGTNVAVIQTLNLQ